MGEPSVEIVAARDIVARIDQCLAGKITVQELEHWAEQREASDKYDYAEADRDVVASVLFQLANPDINGSLTADRLAEVRALLAIHGR